MQRVEINPAQTVLVIGGRGFIGRAIVAQLETLGASVLVGSRCIQTPRRLGTRRVVLHEARSDEECEELLNGIDVVINAAGILRQRKAETYEQVHHLAVAQLARACAKKSIRFVHVSALGLSNPVTSRFLRSKLLGEQAIKISGADWYICRSSIVDGDGGYGAKWFRRVAKWPVHFAPANALGSMAPITVADLGEAVTMVALKTEAVTNDADRIFELGGGETMGVFEYLQVLSPSVKTRAFRIPAWISRLASHTLDLLDLTPFSFGHYELLKFDNCPKSNQVNELLGRRCVSVCYENMHVINGQTKVQKAIINPN